MAITKTITLYEFDELNEEAQETALNSLCDINVDCRWWDYIYEDAYVVGLKIKEFDIDHKTIRGDFQEYPLEVCRLIRKNHGKDCDTFETAAAYRKEYVTAFMKWRKAQIQQSEPYTSYWKLERWYWLGEFKFEDEATEIEFNFLKALLEDYLIMLCNEYKYQTSREQVVETIKANDYLFTELGKPA